MKFSLMALAAIALGTASANAADNPFARDAAVLQLKGLDLSTPAGQQRLAIRMDDAARAVCGDRLSSVHLALARQSRACQTAVKADIRAQIEGRTAVASKDAPIQLASLR